MRRVGGALTMHGWVWILGGVVLSGAAVWMGWGRPEGDAGSRLTPSAADTRPTTIRPPVAQAVKPPRPRDDYVGSAACARCHAEIAETYRQHPMYHSAGLVPGENEVERFDERSELHPPGNRYYKVERTADRVLHHEIMVNSEGETIYDDARPVRLFIGSGTRGKSYALESHGALYQSPISWFSGEGGGWGLSPGYPNDHSTRFDRRIADECIMCHAGRMACDPEGENRFREPIMLEAGIGCERCHGPGAGHMVRHESAENVAGLDDPIVNPARLDPARRESICNQCHLHGKLLVTRYGRSYFDFRPGELLDDAWTVVVEDAGVLADGATNAVSQVQQMRESACYRGSDGRLGCSSCHPAHAKPDPASAAGYYRSRCLECHAQQGCSLPESQRFEPPAENSCIHCHMPRLSAHMIAHTSLTDHQVPRAPRTAIAEPSPSSPHDPDAFFDHAEQRLAPWEVDRVRGLIAVMESQQNPRLAALKQHEAEAFLKSALQAAPDDLLALQALSQIAGASGRHGEERRYLERILQGNPQHERALRQLMGLSLQSQDYSAGAEYGERLLAVNPWFAGDHARQSELLFRLGQTDRALRALEESLKRDPSQTAMRKWIVDAYRRAGDEAAARPHIEILNRLEASPRDSRPIQRDPAP